jgi:hypothetical protein
MRGLIGCQGQGRLTESDKTGNCLHGPGATAREKHAGCGELHTDLALQNAARTRAIFHGTGCCANTCLYRITSACRAS